MANYLKLDNLIKLCEEKGIVNDVKNAKSVSSSRQIVLNNLDSNIKVSRKSIEEYLRILNESDDSTFRDKNIFSEEASNPTSDNEELSTDPLIIGNDENDDIATNDFQKTNETKSGESSNKSNKKHNKDTSNTIDTEKEVIFETTIVEREAIIIDNVKAQLYEEIATEVNAYKDRIKNLQSELESFRTLFSRHVNSQDEDESKKKNKLSTTIHSLNELINSGNEKISVEINKELLSKATKYVDSNALIKLESIVREGYDLNSTIVQSILLAFIHQNSLL